MSGRRPDGGVREDTSLADVRAIEQAMGPERELVALRLRRGCRCFAAWNGDAVLGYGWLSSGPEWIGEVGLELTPAPGEAYIWNCVTLPPHRLRGVFRQLVAAILERARAEGLQRLWIAGLAGTAESALGPLGFEPVVRITRSADELVVDAVAPEGLAVLGLDARRRFPAGPSRRH